MAFDRSDFEVVEEKPLWRGFFEVVHVTLRHRLFRGGWSGDVQRVVARRREAVGVLLYDPKLDALAMTEQFRVGALKRKPSPWLLELVAGLMEPGESPEDVARRECLEEAGTEIQALEFAASYYSSPGGSDEYFHLYCGLADLGGAEGIYGLPEEAEDIRLRVMPVAEAVALLDDGTIDNAHSMVAMNWFCRHHQRLKQAWS